MKRKWKIVLALVAVVAAVCVAVFLLPRRLGRLVSPDADAFSISSAIVEASGKMSVDAVTITDAAALSALAQAICTAKVTYVGGYGSIDLEGITLYSVYPTDPSANKLCAFSVSDNGYVYLEGKKYRLTAGCRDAFALFFAACSEGAGVP